MVNEPSVFELSKFDCIWRLICYFLFLMSPSLDASGILCLVTEAFSVYMYLPFLFRFQIRTEMLYFKCQCFQFTFANKNSMENLQHCLNILRFG